MERTLTQEERIRRAEEIYLRRKSIPEYRNNRSTSNTKQMPKGISIRLFKRMALQIVICLLLYCVFYLIYDTDYSFSDTTLNKTQEILEYDINFGEIYKYINENIMGYINKKNNPIQEDNADTAQTNDELNNNETNNNEINNNEQETNETNLTNNNAETTTDQNIQQEVQEPTVQTSAQEPDLKQIYSLIRPVSGGYISSEFGARESTSEIVSTNHRGIDIAMPTGTSVISAMDGKVVTATNSITYGNYIIIEKGELRTVYAHCSKLLVNSGKEVKQGQEIAKVGETGNATGPHLHFEIRINNNPINPRLIVDF